jgi:4-hydroxy-tetrahydrodipicolinate reductase
VGRGLRIKVSGDVRKAIKTAKPDAVVLCTSSSLKKVLPQMEEILKLKVPIVSTPEELAYPTKGNMRYARAIPPAGEEVQGRGTRHPASIQAS